MTDVTMPLLPAMIKLPTREDWRELIAKPSVIITAIVCGTLLALSALAGVVYLAVTGHDTAVVGTLITITFGAIGVLMSNRIRRVENTVQQQQQQQTGAE